MANKNQAIADKFFKKNPSADKVYICDGFEFNTSNAANLHKNTSGKKGLKVVEFERKEAEVDATVNNTSETAPKPLKKMNLAELKAVATKEEIRFDEKVTKAVLIEEITKVRDSKSNK
jgi:hypothetical protein